MLDRLLRQRLRLLCLQLLVFFLRFFHQGRLFLGLSLLDQADLLRILADVLLIVLGFVDSQQLPHGLDMAAVDHQDLLEFRHRVRRAPALLISHAQVIVEGPPVFEVGRKIGLQDLHALLVAARSHLQAARFDPDRVLQLLDPLLNLLAVLLIMSELEEALPGQDRLLVQADVQIGVTQIVVAHGEPGVGLRQKLEPVQSLRLEPADVLFVAAVLIHDPAGPGVTVHRVEIVVLDAKAGAEVDAGVVHFAPLRRVSAFLHQVLEQLVAEELVHDLHVVLSILEVRITAHDPGHVLRDDHHRDTVTAGKGLDFLSPQGHRNAFHHVPGL